MREQQFLTPKDVLGYTEEYFFIEEDHELLNFSLSNCLDDIKIAIHARTGINFDLDNAYWELSEPLIGVKHLMNKHRVTYSMTTCYEEEKKMEYLIVFMRVGDKWFSTRYNKKKDGLTYNYEKYSIYKKVVKFIKDSNFDDRDTLIGLLKEIVL